jgi:hypothetical protein
MIGKEFLGTLRKYENVRRDNKIFVKVLIKHINEQSVQTFLDSFAKKLGIDNIENLFACPVRWRKSVIDTSDFIKRTYSIDFGELEFVADLQEISITHKLSQGNDIFEYSLLFIKEASKDTQDQLIAEAYLNYKEEDEKGKEKIVDFRVKIELLENVERENHHMPII